MSNNGAVHQEVSKIPDMDGTGPRWLGKRTFSRRGRWSYTEIPEKQVIQYEPNMQEEISSLDLKPVYGVGHGGLPRGCGRRIARRWNSFIQVYYS